MFSELYQDLILEHAKNPRLKGTLEQPTAELTLQNPLCGDELGIALRVESGVVQEAKFTGHGCTISQAAGSMVTNLLVGRSLEEALRVAENFRLLLHDKLQEEERAALGELLALEGVKRYPTRLKCALLASEVAQKVLKSAAPGA
jgi:nitrogen fixation NifU-like protein